jgi:starvation-inducible outer membrane lipoprotein
MKKTLTIISATLLFASCTITTPVAVTNNTLGSKQGISNGNIFKAATVGEAVKNGGITKIATVDKSVKITNLFGKHAYIVSGE